MNKNINNIKSKRVKSEVEFIMKENHLQKKGDHKNRTPNNGCKRFIKYLRLKYLKKKHFN